MNDSNSTLEGESELTFEQAFEGLEETVVRLEDGRIGLSDALHEYEKGVKYLKHCHTLLDHAERQVSLLSGIAEDGSAITEPFEEENASLTEKSGRRSRRRSSRVSKRDVDQGDGSSA